MSTKPKVRNSDETTPPSSPSSQHEPLPLIQHEILLALRVSALVWSLLFSGARLYCLFRFAHSGNTALLIGQHLLQFRGALAQRALERFTGLCYDVAKPKKECV